MSAGSPRTPLSQRPSTDDKHGRKVILLSRPIHRLRKSVANPALNARGNQLKHPTAAQRLKSHNRHKAASQLWKLIRRRFARCCASQSGIVCLPDARPARRDVARSQFKKSADALTSASNLSLANAAVFIQKKTIARSTRQSYQIKTVAANHRFLRTRQISVSPDKERKNRDARFARRA